MLKTLLVLLTSVALLSACGEQAKPGKKGKPKKRSHLVETLAVAPQQVAIQRERTGTLKIRRLVRIHSQEEGQITRLPHFEGDQVKQGQLLASLEDGLLQAQFNKAEANLRQARRDLERLERLANKKLTSDDELARARTMLEVAEAELRLLQTRISYTRITAPFSGIISERMIEAGDVAKKHHHLLTLIDPQSLIAEAAISEILLPHLRLNDRVSIRIDALGKTTYQGKILRIHPQLDPLTRQGKVEVTFDRIPANAKSGQLARLTFTTPARERLLIPFNALQRDHQGEYLYLLEQGNASFTRVSSGVRIGEKVEIIEGIRGGDVLITRGFMGLTDGKAVKPATRSGHEKE